MPSSRTTRCRECARDLLDVRWAPLCPVCHESRRHEERRAQIRPPTLHDPGWSDPARLEAAFDKAVGPELP